MPHWRHAEAIFQKLMSPSLTRPALGQPLSFLLALFLSLYLSSLSFSLSLSLNRERDTARLMVPFVTKNEVAQVRHDRSSSLSDESTSVLQAF